jgi:hypothetical protein
MPATATRTRPRVNPQTQPQTEVETSAEEAVVVDTGLIKLLEKWDKSKEIANKSQEQADQSWIQIAKYVRDHEITKAQLHYALVEVRGMKEASARVEITRLMRFQISEAASEMLDRKLEGDDNITVHDLRSASVKRGEKAPEIDPVTAVERKLIAVAKFAISEAEIEDISEFTSLARKSYKAASAKIESSKETEEAEAEVEVEAELEETEEEETEE